MAEKQLEEVRQIFLRFDLDGSGTIDEEEVMCLMDECVPLEAAVVCTQLENASSSSAESERRELGRKEE